MSCSGSGFESAVPVFECVLYTPLCYRKYLCVPTRASKYVVPFGMESEIVFMAEESGLNVHGRREGWLGLFSRGC
jgi:hypothetical protein